MKLAIDYDDTYTEDPELFDRMIRIARNRNHKVYIVTMRSEEDPVEVGAEVDGVFYTRLRAKRLFMKNRGVVIDVWIDDNPQFVDQDHPSLGRR